MAHPCDGHACDHCYTCDVLGICCASVPSSVAPAAYDRTFRDAVVREADSMTSLLQLIQVEAGNPPASATSYLAQPTPTERPALPLAPPSTDSLIHNTTQEVDDVPSPRHHS